MDIKIHSHGSRWGIILDSADPNLLAHNLDKLLRQIGLQRQKEHLFTSLAALRYTSGAVTQ